MSQSYEEILEGTTLVRRAPGPRHELICARLHRTVKASVADLVSARLLDPRSEVRLSEDTTVCPDLALITVANGKLWLAAEIVNSDDHRTDTVVKKQIYTLIRKPLERSSVERGSTGEPDVNSKLQSPSFRETSNAKAQCATLELVASSFPGAWSLEFEAFSFPGD